MHEDEFELLGNADMAVGPFGVQTKGLVQTHGPEKCAGEFCCIHNPSDHPLKDARLNFRFDRGFTERICAHGVGHPDPDSLAFLRRVMTTEDYESRAFGIHGCDGCCKKEAA